MNWVLLVPKPRYEVSRRARPKPAPRVLPHERAYLTREQVAELKAQTEEPVPGSEQCPEAIRGESPQVDSE